MRLAVPEFLLGVILLAYWGRVMRMAFKTRRQTGRAANLVPGERLGKIIRILWTPVILIWVTQPFVVLFGCKAAWCRPLYIPPPWIAWLALGIAFFGLFLSRLCWKAMGRHWRMGIDPQEQNPLIDAGPFAVIRHPIYALSGLIMLATLAMIPTPLMLMAGVIHLLLLFWESRREENHLLRVHGQRYVAYRRKAGAFLPRIWSGRCESVR